MPSRLLDHLKAVRQHRFVGRADELANFRSALTRSELPFHVLYIFGPGGVGKTSLLSEFTRICDQTQIPATYIDARNVEPAPEAFTKALQLALDLAPPESPLEALTSRSQRHVLFIDTYETLMPLDGWLRDVFLPQLPAEVLIVLAGRHPPALGWRIDPGWQSLVHILPLRNLSPEESRFYLTKRAVPSAEHPHVLAFTHGHPLALSRRRCL